MYFWRINNLISDLGSGRIAERQKMYYYLAGSLLSLLSIAVSLLLPAMPNIYTVLNILLSLLLTAAGILLCFEANARGDGEEFLTRMVCLSWVINIRLLSVLIPLYIAYGIYLSMSGASGEAGPIDVLLTTAYVTYFYKWLHHALTRVAGEPPVPTPLPETVA